MNFKCWTTLILTALTLCGGGVAAKHSSGYDAVTLRSREAGLFSIFYDVLALVRSYELGHFKAVRVDFGTTGYYYEPQRGANWWEYYFEPIKLGTARWHKAKEVLGGDRHINPMRVELGCPRHEVGALVRKYVRVKPHIQSQVDDFAARHFAGYYVIAVHYRGTDKVAEAPKVPYRTVAQRLDAEIGRCGKDKIKIFVASDEQAFITFMQELYGEALCYNDTALHSTDGTPLHYNQHDQQYKRGEDALIDCLLLARADLLLRTSSNLSKCATYFNLQMPVIELSQRHQGRR